MMSGAAAAANRPRRRHKAIYKNVNAALQGRISPKSALSNAQKQIDGVLATSDVAQPLATTTRALPGVSARGTRVCRRWLHHGVAHRGVRLNSIGHVSNTRREVGERVKRFEG